MTRPDSRSERSDPHDAGQSALAADKRIGGVRRPPLVDAVRDRVPDSAARVVKGTLHGMGRATSVARPLPDFLVVGTKKGGTTSLMDWLIGHRDVARLFPPIQRRKSPHYFDLNFWRGESWYRSHFCSRPALALQQRRTGRRPIVGEASPYYLFHPAVAERAYELLPAARIIIALRDPVSRAYSHYWDRVATGHEDLRTFEAAIDAEQRRIGHLTEDDFRDPHFYSYDHDHHSYLARGRYLEQIDRWTVRYPAEQVLILSANDLSRRPQESFDQVQTFLGIAPATVPLASRNARNYPPMDSAIKARLIDYYQPHNSALYDALGRDFEW